MAKTFLTLSMANRLVNDGRIRKLMPELDLPYRLKVFDATKRLGCSSCGGSKIPDKLKDTYTVPWLAKKLASGSPDVLTVVKSLVKTDELYSFDSTALRANIIRVF